MIYITKHALSRGILTAEDHHCKRVGSRAIAECKDGKTEQFHGLGKEWHLSAEGAIECAEKMRKKRAGVLERELAALRKRDMKRMEPI